MTAGPVPFFSRLAARLRRRRVDGRVRPLHRALAGRPSPAFRGGHVAVVGAFGSGDDFAADGIARGLEGEGGQVRRVDVSALLGPSASAADHEGLDALGDAALTDIVVHVNPPAFYRLLPHLDPAALGDRCFVLSVTRALANASADWRPALAVADEIWVPATVGRDALEAVLPEAAARILVRPPLP